MNESMDGGQDEAVVEPERGRRTSSRLGRIVRISRTRFLARLRNYFFAGLLVTAPITITLWIAWEVVVFFDGWLQGMLPPSYNPNLYLPFSVPGIGLLVFLVVLTMIGALAAGLIGRSIVHIGERLLARMPVIRGIYGALKQIFETVLAKKSGAFRQVVLFEYPRRGVWCMGFVSGKTEGEIQNLTEDEVLNVFLPTTPNPTSGFLLFVPRQDLIFLGMTVEEGVKMVVSGGIVTPPDRRPDVARAMPVTGLRGATERAAADETGARLRTGRRSVEKVGYRPEAVVGSDAPDQPDRK